MTFPKWKLITLASLIIVLVVVMFLFRPVTDGYGESLAAGDATVLTAKADLVDSEANLSNSRALEYQALLGNESSAIDLGYMVLLICAAIGTLLVFMSLAVSIISNGVSNAVVNAKTRAYAAPKGSIAERHLTNHGLSIANPTLTRPKTPRPEAPEPGSGT